jgi:peptidoglycan LD-endopeptidase CwlK
MQGLHPLLIKLLNEAVKFSPYDFTVIDGMRTLAEQKALVAAGKSKTMRSRHLSGKAVDVMALIDGKGSWDAKYYKQIAAHVKAVAKRLEIDITWGGDWASFPDLVHFELNKNTYGY